MNNAYLLKFTGHGGSNAGYLTAYEKNTGVPFEIKRVYTVTQTEEGQIRGHHAHRELEQLIVALQGSVEVHCEGLDGECEDFLLEKEDQALYCGPEVWHTLKYGKNAVLLVMASAGYDERDYIRSYDEFLERGNRK